mgnify:FL=1
MSLVTLERFNKLRFPDDPVKLTKLQRWCRRHKLPARKIGGEWYVNLKEFDSTKHVPKDDPAEVVRLVVERMRQHG